MADEVMAQLPMTAVFTSEFDSFRRCSTNFAEKLHKNGRLCEFVIHPGLNHPSGIHLTDDTPFQMQFWKDLTQVV